jgi:uridine kinase
MVNEIVQQEHVFVIQGDYYYRMVNDRKQIYKEEHQETKIDSINSVDFF